MDSLSRKNGLTVLARLARRRPEQEGKLQVALAGRLKELGSIAISVAVEHGDPLGRVLADVFRNEGDSELPARLHEEIPANTVALSELAVEVTGKLVNQARSMGEDAFPLLARRLHDFARALVQAGSARESLTVAEEEFRIWSQLSEAGKGDDLGVTEAFLSLATANRKLGRRMAALEAARNAVRRLEAAVISDTERAERLLPNALIDAASAYLEAGALRDAIEMCIKTMEHIRGHSGAAAVEVRALTIRANALRGMGQLHDALIVNQATVDRLRDLVEAHDDAYRPDLQMALSDLSLRLVEAGHREKAIDAADESVRIARELADARPNAFGRTLAMSLHSRAQCLANLGRREEALRAAEDAIARRRDIAEALGGDPRPDLAAFEDTRASFLSRLGRIREAVRASETSDTTYRELAHEIPEIFFPGLANSRGNLANHLRDAGERERSLNTSAEVVEIWRLLVKGQDGDVFRGDLALSLANHTAMLLDAGDFTGALPLARESANIFGELARQYPARYADRHAWALANLSAALDMAGDQAGAIEACRSSVSGYRALEGDLRSLRTKEFGIALYTLAAQEIQAGDPRAGLLLCQEGIGILKDANASSDATLLETLASTFANEGYAYELLRRFREAEASNTEAISIYGRLNEARAGAYDEQLSRVLNNQSNVLGALRRAADALSAMETAVKIRRDLAARRPHRFCVSLGRSLTGLASRHSELTDIASPIELLDAAGQRLRRQAIKFAEEAVAVLHAARDAGYPKAGGELAMALRNLAVHCQRAGSFLLAENAAAKAVDEYRRLEKGGATSHAGAMVEALGVHAELLLALGRGPEASRDANEALGRANSLFAQKPDAFRQLKEVATIIVMKAALAMSLQPTAIRSSDHPFGPGRPFAKVGRNEPCPCGSGKKFKRCCGSS
jgi:tetratricopeptide (TPR) repeat protein